MSEKRVFSFLVPIQIRTHERDIVKVIEKLRDLRLKKNMLMGMPRPASQNMHIGNFNIIPITKALEEWKRNNEERK